jgi:hypothetical protein
VGEDDIGLDAERRQVGGDLGVVGGVGDEDGLDVAGQVVGRTMRWPVTGR